MSLFFLDLIKIQLNINWLFIIIEFFSKLDNLLLDLQENFRTSYIGLVKDIWKGYLLLLYNIIFIYKWKFLIQMYNYCVGFFSGSFLNASLNSCVPCKKGTYQPAAQQSTCLPCPPNTITKKIAAVNIILTPSPFRFFFDILFYK